MTKIPLIDDTNQTMIIALGGQRVRLAVQYIPMQKGWYIWLSEANTQKEIISGARLSHNEFLFKKTHRDFSGDFLVNSIDKGASDLNANSWGITHELIYFNQEQVAEYDSFRQS